jgi:peptide deformylase
MLQDVKVETLDLVSYPHPVLRQMCQPVELIDERTTTLVRKMWEIMHRHNGVGLAAPQVGLPLRLFVWNPTGEPADDRVCINPRLLGAQGVAEASEGCLSLADVNVDVRRAQAIAVEAEQLDGSTVRWQGEDLIARIWQHENDHLNGRLIIDYQTPAEAIANRKALKELEARFTPPKKKPAGRHRGGKSRRNQRLRR